MSWWFKKRETATRNGRIYFYINGNSFLACLDLSYKIKTIGEILGVLFFRVVAEAPTPLFLQEYN